MAKYEMRITLDTRSLIDKEIVRLLKDKDPKQRKEFLAKALFYYSRAPQFTAQAEMKLLFESFLKDLNSKLQAPILNSPIQIPVQIMQMANTMPVSIPAPSTLNIEPVEIKQEEIKEVKTEAIDVNNLLSNIASQFEI